ncbi:MAG: hypothetical protein PHU12_03925 [Candidatus Aenigmarchaeota archaeon]|nr:hypothetical protein [Candidatus Aenigmarchaeota archaeon]
MSNKKGFPFLIGADPEFNIISQGNRMDAGGILEDFFDGMDSEEKRKKNIVKESMGFDIGKSGNIGWDGASSTGEIRPEPANTPAGIVNNLRRILLVAGQKLEIFTLTTLSMGAPVGGHIHFQLKDQNKYQKDIHKISRVMSSFFLPILLGENKINIQARLNNGYGEMSDHRVEHPTSKTFEFRTPTAEWMTTPKIACSTLAYLATVFYEATETNGGIDKFDNLILKTKEQGEALQTLALTDFMTLTKKITSDIEKAVKTFKYYPVYKKEIDYILNFRKVLKDKRKVNYDMAVGWGIGGKMNFNKKELMSKKEFVKRALKKDIDENSNLISMPFNNDTQVSTFAKTLTEKIVAFNWHLNKRYFLFGLSKEFSDFVVIDEKGDVKCKSKDFTGLVDLIGVQTYYKKMAQKAANAHRDECSKYREGRINWAEGLVEKNNILAIGIPYNMRIKGDTSSLIKLIYDIEKGKKKIISEGEIIKDLKIGKSNTEKFKIFNAIMEKAKKDGKKSGDSNYQLMLRNQIFSLHDLIERELEQTRDTLNNTTENLSQENPDPTVDLNEAIEEALNETYH